MNGLGFAKHIREKKTKFKNNLLWLFAFYRTNITSLAEKLWKENLKQDENM